MKASERERFEALAEEGDYASLVDLCDRALTRSEKLETQLAEEKAAATNIKTAFYDFLSDNNWVPIVALLCSPVFLLLCALAIKGSFGLFMPGITTDNYYLEWCVGGAGYKVMQRVVFGNDLQKTACSKDYLKVERALSEYETQGKRITFDRSLVVRITEVPQKTEEKVVVTEEQAEAHTKFVEEIKAAQVE